MLHYVHKLAANMVHLLFVVRQVVYNEFIRAFSLKTVDESGKTGKHSKVAGCGTITMS